MGQEKAQEGGGSDIIRREDLVSFLLELETQLQQKKSILLVCFFVLLLLQVTPNLLTL